MKGFDGFPQKGRLTKIPGVFFSDLLPQIDHLAELKVTLYCFWRLQQKEGQIVYMRRSEIMADKQFMKGLGPREDARLAALQEGLERAAARGTLLHVHEAYKGRDDDLYFVNAPRGQVAVAAIEAGTWQPSDEPDVMLDLSVERPNIFTVYEQNIGPLTPIIADRLRDWDETYPSDWIHEAIAEAVKYNKRSLAYIDKILDNWQQEGRADKPPEAKTDNRERYTSGKYKDEIEY